MTALPPIQRGVLPGRILQCQQRHLAALNKSVGKLTRQLRDARRQGQDTTALVKELQALNQERKRERGRQRNIAFMQGLSWLKL